MIDLREHGIGLGASVKKYFGDGSDGAFDTGALPTGVVPIITSEYAGATIQNINDNNADTIFQATVSMSQVLLSIDFPVPVLVSSFTFLGMRVTSSSATVAVQGSYDKIDWFTCYNMNINTNYNDILAPINMYAKHFRLYITYSSSITFQIKDFSFVLRSGGNISILANPKDTIVFNFTSIRVRAGNTVTTSSSCQGLCLYSLGDVLIEGTLTMSEKAHYYITSPPIPVFTHELGGIDCMLGGIGGNSGSGLTGGVGRIMAGGTGAGGQGGGTNAAAIVPDGISGLGPGTGGTGTYKNQSGVSGTPYTIGTYNGGGGGEAYYASAWTGGTLWARGGGGGRGNGAGGGGGGYAYNGYDGSTDDIQMVNAGTGGDGGYVGGAICLIVKGSVNITSTGKITADGAPGGNGGHAAVSNPTKVTLRYGGHGGGGAGGGVVVILYSGAYLNSGTVTVNGGTGGAGGYASTSPGLSGTSGSVGTIKIQKI